VGLDGCPAAVAQLLAMATDRCLAADLPEVASDVVITAAALCALLEVLLGTAPELLPPMTYGSRKQ
jgi:hypothetical protein